jgi:large subunit ribosomal protein L35
MPKLKTRKSAAKRFKVTGSGKIMRRNTSRAHLLEHKSATRRRRLAGISMVFEGDLYNIHGMLPYI